MAKNFEDLTKKFLNQAKSSAEGFGDMTGKTAKEIRDALERQGVKPVSLHLRNGERIDALMTPEQRKELDRLISRGRGGLVSVKEAVFVSDRKRFAEAAEDFRVSAAEVIAVGVRALKDESDAFFAGIGQGKTAKEKFEKMREAMNQPLGKASRDKASGVSKEEPFRPSANGQKQAGPAPKKPAAKTGASANGRRSQSPAAKPAAKKPARKPAARKPAAKKGAAGKAPATRKPRATKSTAKKNTASPSRPAAKKGSARKATGKTAATGNARKPAAKKPAARKPAAKKPAARKPAGGRTNQRRKSTD